MDRDELTMIVARNIEAIMERKGTNAAEVARRMGSNPTAVYDILSGKSRNPRLDTLHKIAVKGLGVPMTELLHQPMDATLDQELREAFAAMSPADRKRILGMVQAYVAQLTSA